MGVKEGESGGWKVRTELEDRCRLGAADKSLRPVENASEEPSENCSGSDEITIVSDACFHLLE